MAEVKGFAGVRYRLDRPEAAEAVIAPPYDVVSPEDREGLLQRSEHNVIRLELPVDQSGDNEQENRYTRAAALYREWLASGVLQQDGEPCLYVYGQRYEVSGREQERLGLLAALKIEPYEAGVVLPHEQTFPKHKEDRFRLLSTAEAQFSPIFGLYSAPEAEVREGLVRVTEGEPAAAARDRDGVLHRLWPVSDPEFAEWLTGVFAGKQVFIADGHHRYETSLRYRDHRRAQTPDAPLSAFDYVMTFLVEMDDPGLVLLPTHRMVRQGLPAAAELRSRLEEAFTVEEVSLDDADQLAHHQVGLVLPETGQAGRAWRLTLKDPALLAQVGEGQSAAWRDLDVVLLHHLVFDRLLGLDEEDNIVYTRDPAEARSGAVSGQFSASFLLPYPRVEELKLVAGAGDKMPHKSTYFWPKAVTGLVIYPE